MSSRRRTNNDFQQMALAMSLYLHTDAGAEAANWLATYMLDRGRVPGRRPLLPDPHQPLRPDQPQGRPAASRPPTPSTTPATSTGQGRRPQGARTPRRRASSSATSRRPVADLKDAIDKFVASVSAESASDSPIYRGRPSRNAMLPGGTPFLEPAWKQQDGPHRRDAPSTSRRPLDALAAAQPAASSAPSARSPPRHAKGDKKIPLLVYRDFKGVDAVNLKTGKHAVGHPSSDWSLDNVLGADRHATATATRSTPTRSGCSQLASSQHRPAADPVRELRHRHPQRRQQATSTPSRTSPCPPPQNLIIANPGFGGQPASNWGQEVNDAINHNKLVAIRMTPAASSRGSSAARDGKARRWPTASSSAPPLPLNGKLYVLNEKQQELRLVTLDPDTGKVLAMQPLATTKDLKLGHDPLRRIQACHLAYGEGILVVPTNAGAVFGVDLLSGSLAVGVPLRREAGQRPTSARPRQGRLGPGQPPGPGWVCVNGRCVPRLGRHATGR